MINNNKDHINNKNSQFELQTLLGWTCLVIWGTSDIAEAPGGRRGWWPADFLDPGVHEATGSLTEMAYGRIDCFNESE